jgi:hypothetical protein
MASLGINFNPAEVDPQKPLDKTPIPAGKYIVIVDSSDVKPTKSGTGSFAEFVLQVADGEYAGRKLWARITLQNPNAQAVQIGRSQLSALTHAVGHFGAFTDTEVLHGRTCVAVVGVKKREDNGEYANEVNGYESLNASPASAPKSSPAKASPTSPPAGVPASRPVWQRQTAST